jgi:hypothetical protein
MLLEGQGSQGNNQQFRQGILAAALIVMVIGGSLGLGTAGGSAGETSSWNAGTSSCVITAGNNQCSNTFTWPTPLSAAPCAGCGSVTLSTTTGGVSDQTIVAPAPSHESFFDIGTDFSISGKWTNMPAIQTVIFGDGFCEHCIIVNWSNVVGVDFVIVCPTASTSVTAVLQVQYSADQGTTWNSIAGLSININTICGLGLPVDSCFSTTGTTFGCYVTNPVQNDGIFLRIVGSGGGGIGDSPVFQTAYVLAKSASYTVKFLSTINIAGTTATTISVTAKINVLQISSTTVNWRMTAWICKTGGSGPC